MTSWPAGLPSNLNADDYAEQRLDGVVRTTMDAGPDFIRRRFTATPTRLSGSLVLTKDQVAELELFYETTLRGGSLTFDWAHPRTGAAVVMRFTGRPAYRAFSNDLFQASVAMEILP